MGAEKRNRCRRCSLTGIGGVEAGTGQVTHAVRTACAARLDARIRRGALVRGAADAAEAARRHARAAPESRLSADETPVPRNQCRPMDRNQCKRARCPRTSGSRCGSFPPSCSSWACTFCRWPSIPLSPALPDRGGIDCHGGAVSARESRRPDRRTRQSDRRHHRSSRPLAAHPSGGSVSERVAPLFHVLPACYEGRNCGFDSSEPSATA